MENNKTRILGIDTGTNSLGWAIVDKTENGEYNLVDKGVHIFQEGVKIEKGIESSKAAERTEHRQLRKRYYRLRVRKIRLLSVLIDNQLCPPVRQEMLRNWRLKKVYPNDDDFMVWQKTDDNFHKNPYYYRYLCLTQKLDLSDMSNRYILGRALYHLNQRRGFLSNRKETTEDVDGKVKQGISDLSNDMEKAGCKYLGEYFYLLYNKGQKIRQRYTSRNEHYLAEFEAICQKQQLEKIVVDKIRKAIFYQRPLKSQKGTVGKCTFEKNKSRCPASHPMYEEYRLYAFINSIKIQGPNDAALRSLNQEEINSILPKFYRKSKAKFEFKDLAKELAGKRSYGYKTEDVAYRFNYYMDAIVAGCPVTAQLKEIFGEDWLDGVSEVFLLSEGKSQMQVMNDIWHVLFFFSDEEKLKQFAITRLQLNDDEAAKFAKIKLPSDYAPLSLKAISKILPYMKHYGLIYSKAVFLANLEAVIPKYEWNNPLMREAVINDVIEAMNTPDQTIEKSIGAYLLRRFHVDPSQVKKLYHPSMIELYPKAHPDDEGHFKLGSPRISSVKNPMAMHSLFRLRNVVNQLLKEQKIDENTIVHIEFSRELNDANRRKAIHDTDRLNSKNRANACQKIKELYREETGVDIDPTDTDILKYQLWEEQNHKCLYTGKEIRIADFLGANPKYDIEHTIPQSVGGDSTKMNLTLCENSFNRYTKRTKLPSELSNIDEILERIAPWKEQYEKLESQIRKLKSSYASTKEAKDAIIQKRHRLLLERDYWKGKYSRFTMTEVPEGFSRRQGTDISVISRYARQYLKSVFNQVYVVKGIATSDFRIIWGIQQEYTKKERVNHVHHCIDAITIACIGKNEYDKLAQYYHDKETHDWDGTCKAVMTPPWPTFVVDMQRIQNEILVSHYTADYVGKKAKRYIRSSDGKKILSQGDAARVSLHQDTYYGAINRNGNIVYVVRKPLDSLEEKNVQNIVDDTVRNKVEEAVKKHGSLKKAVEEGVWMNEEKQIPIKKVRVFTPSVTNPMHIREMRDKSRFDYKRKFHVANDRNYMMAIYLGVNDKGKEKRDFKLISNLNASKNLRQSKKDGRHELIPLSSEENLPLRYCLKIGTMVLLYENSPAEIYEASKEELLRRYYKVTGLSSMKLSKTQSYGLVFLLHNQEARPSSEIKMKNGKFVSGENYRPGIKMLHTQMNALVEGYDFTINSLGEIKFLHK